MDDIG
jgi:hypothetical protein